MIMNISKINFDEKEIKELRSINDHVTVNFMYLADDIFRGVVNQMQEENELDTTWIRLSSLSCVMTHGYMLGVRAEREKQRKKKAPNGDRD